MSPAMGSATTATLLVVLVSVLAAAVMNVESASHSAPAPAADCSTVIANLVDCLSFVTNDTVKKPEGSCCSGLKTVLKTNPECLCETFKNSAQLGVTLNVTKALSLPAACHLKAPSFSNCGISLAPGGAPASSPMEAPSPMAGAPSSEVAFSPMGVAPVPGKSDSPMLVVSAVTLVLGLVFSLSLS